MWCYLEWAPTRKQRHHLAGSTVRAKQPLLNVGGTWRNFSENMFSWPGDGSPIGVLEKGPLKMSQKAQSFTGLSYLPLTFMSNSEDFYFYQCSGPRGQIPSLWTSVMASLVCLTGVFFINSAARWAWPTPPGPQINIYVYVCICGCGCICIYSFIIFGKRLQRAEHPATATAVSWYRAQLKIWLFHEDA